MRTFLAFFVLVVGLLSAANLPAQVPQQFGIWRYDSSFTIGCRDMPRINGIQKMTMTGVNYFSKMGFECI